MNWSTKICLTLAVLVGIGVTAVVWGNQRRPSGALPAPMVKIEVRGSYRYITSNGIPNHSVGQFPNPNNPNSIVAQSYKLRIPLKPTPAQEVARRPPGALFGVAINGVPFDPGTAEFWNGRREWTFEALAGYLFTTRGGLGVDRNLAHVQPTGAYHYHGLPYGLLEKLDYKNKMVLVGYAADGFPIYGPYGYLKPNDPTSGLSLLRPSYRLKSGNRLAGGPGGAYDGSFKQDYEYIAGLGDLDAYNGRTGVTPEYPDGTYYYVLTAKFPYVARALKGVPDPSFSTKGPGGRGGPGGPPPFGGPPGGFPPPPGGFPPSGGFPPPGGGGK